MEIKTYVLMAVSVITAAVVFGACLPVFADTTQANDTFTNEGLYYVESPIPEGETITYTFDGTDWTVNTETITFGYGNNVIVTDSFLIRTAGATGQIRGSVEDTFKAGTFEVTNAGIDYDYTKANDTTASGTWTYTDVYCAVLSEAGYIMSDATQPTNYMLADSQIYGFGITNVGGSYVTFKIVGDVESVTVTTTDPDITITNVQIDKTAIDGYIDLYDFNKVTFTATDENNVSVNATYDRVIIPSEVTAERSIHPTGATLTLMELLPVLIGAGLLVGVVGAVIVRRL